MSFRIPLCVVLAVLLSAPCLAASEVVKIDLARETGPATYRASGFLHAMTATTPGPELVDPLKPKLFRMCAEDWHKVGAGAFANYKRVKKIGARMQIVVSDSHGYGLAGWWPGDDGDWTRWDMLVESLIQRARAEKLDVEWDIWNEPNGKYFWPHDQARFFEAWTRAYKKIRQLDPRAKIVGPSVAGYDRKYLEAFLLYAKEQGVVPDLLAWHEFGNPRRIPVHFDEMKSFAKENGIKIAGFSINEIITGGQQLNPGVTLVYLANLDRAGADGACHACWGDQDPQVSGCENHTLDGLLTYPDRKPRASWWAYKAYADVTGRLVNLEPSETVDGIAGADAKAKSINIALGRDAKEAGPVELVIQRADKLPFASASGTVRVHAKRLVSSGWEASEGPVTVFESIRKIEDGQIKLTLPEFGPTDAYTITITQAR